jgi:multiple antibiotic resistance protein
MNALGLTEPALGIAGGVVLALIALRMIFPSREHPLEEEVEAEPFIVPLAIPYIAGPSSMAMVMLLMSREPERWLDWVAAILLAWAVTVPIILAGARLRVLLGERGLIAIERLMGLVLVTIAVQMLLNGVTHFLGKG